MRQIFTLLLVATLLFACNEEKPTPKKVSFSRDISPIIRSKCIPCHLGDRTPMDLSSGEYYNILARDYVIPSNAEGSVLYQKLKKNHSIVNTVDENQLELFHNWINEGAPNN